MPEVAAAFGFGELFEDAATECPELVDGALRAVAEQFLQFRKRQLDGVQVGRVGWQITQFRAGSFDRLPHTSLYGWIDCPSPRCRPAGASAPGVVRPTRERVIR